MCKEALDTAGAASAGGIDMEDPKTQRALGTRQSAQGVLNDKIKRTEKHLNGMIVLLNLIPWNALRSEDEESLWELFTRGVWHA